MAAPRTRTPERERKVIELVAAGKFNAEIAHEVGITGTQAVYDVVCVMKAWGARNRVELALMHHGVMEKRKPRL